MKSSREMDAFIQSERAMGENRGGPRELEAGMLLRGLPHEEKSCILASVSRLPGMYPAGWGTVPDEPKASTETGSKWNVHPQSTVADVPAIAKHIRSWHCAACPGVVEVPVELFFAIGAAIESMKTAEAACVPVKDEPKMSTVTPIRYEWRAFPYSGTDMINAEFSKGWEFCGSIGGNCILRRAKP